MKMNKDFSELHPNKDFPGKSEMIASACGIALAGILVICLVLFTGCADKSAGVRVLTPFGTIDTSGTTELDLRGVMQQDNYPPARSYNLDLQPLEK